LPVPHDGSFQPSNTNPAFGMAVRVSTVLAAYDPAQPVVPGVPLVIVQVLVVVPAWSFTFPLPPSGATLVILMVKGPWLNCAVRARSAPILTAQVPVPLQPV
jgi:hypothetical protein